MVEPADSDNNMAVKFPPVVETNRFFLRELTTDDASERYLGWLSEPEARKWIVGANSARRLSDLKSYIFDRIDRPEVLFLGIFDMTNGIHIGNIKYEPIDSGAGLAVMGVLIGDAAYRGKGVVAEVLVASANWLRSHRQIREIWLGVDKQNTSAIRAYEKVGFSVADVSRIPPVSGTADAMVWKITDKATCS